MEQPIPVLMKKNTPLYSKRCQLLFKMLSNLDKEYMEHLKKSRRLNQSSKVNRRKLKNINNWVHNNSEANAVRVESLCDTTNSNRRYITEILEAAGILTCQCSGPSTIQLHKLGLSVNRDLFHVMEKPLGSSEPAEKHHETRVRTNEKIQRKLVFDFVSDILVNKSASLGELLIFRDEMVARNISGEKLLQKLCSKLGHAQATRESSPNDELVSILRAEMMLNDSEIWGDCNSELPRIVLDIEGLIFEDLIHEILEIGYTERNSTSSSPAPAEVQVVEKRSNGFGSTAGNQPTGASTEVISHSYTFRDYSHVKELGGGRFIKSDAFMAGGYEWAIVFYPGSKWPAKDMGYISLFIQLMSQGSEVNGLFEMRVMDQSGRGEHKIRKSKHPCLLKYRNQWGFARFISIEQMEKSGYMKDDCIMVNCSVEVVEIQKKLSNDMHLQIQALEVEFRNILECSVNMVHSTEDQSSTASTTASSLCTSCYSFKLQGGDHEVVEFTSTQIDRLCTIITKTVNLAGTLGFYYDVYVISRKAVVEAKVRRFGIRKWNTNAIRNLDWEGLAEKIKLWIRAAHTCYRSIFPWERHYLDQIFRCSGSTNYDYCFCDIVRDVAVELNKFAAAVLTTSSSFQKLFDILDLYNTMLHIMPQIKSMFNSNSTTRDIYLGAVKTVDGLEQLVRQIISNFEEAVLNEKLNTPLPRGIIHSTTRYAMKYVTRILTYKDSLAKIIKSKPVKNIGISEDEQLLKVGGRNPLEVHLIFIIISLKSNLEIKSRNYNDALLGHLFLMNNVHFMVEKVSESSDLLAMIGEDNSIRLTEFLEAQKIYYRSTWNRVLDCLKDEGLNHRFPFYSGISTSTLKERFKSFNCMFDNICQTQSTWLVQNSQLRGQLHTSILEKLIPAYESFLLKFRSHIESVKQPEKFIKYSCKDLENKVHDLFSGTKKSQGTRRGRVTLVE